MYKLFMEFDRVKNPETGKNRGVQGFAVHGGLGVVLYHTGIAAIYDIAARRREPLGVFPLGSYNAGTPDKRYANHANDAMFGRTLAGEEFPLLYVTAGNSGEADERGYIAYCAVEQIRRTEGGFSAETVQRIYYRDEGGEDSSFTAPGWGWPASLVDVEQERLYFFSAYHRTRRELARPDNAYVVTAFALPDPTVGDVTLTRRDILEQFTLPFNVFFTQGGTLRDGKIWYMFGCGREAHPNALRGIDLQRRSYLLCEDLSGTEFGADEVECCAFFAGRLLVNTQSGKLYMRQPLL